MGLNQAILSCVFKKSNLLTKNKFTKEQKWFFKKFTGRVNLDGIKSRNSLKNANNLKFFTPLMSLKIKKINE